MVLTVFEKVAQNVFGGNRNLEVMKMLMVVILTYWIYESEHELLNID